ncbi:MAG: hypothetical protein Q8936_22535 [Bacillota bacterium]|nr:hypothetical protein [Bacillota bacterium]
MGKQICFFMDEDIEDKFIDYVLENGEILFEGNNNKPISIKELPKAFSGKGWFKVYLYKPEFGKLVLENIPNIREYINFIESPVIEFSRTIIREDIKELSRGRLWVDMKFYNKEGEKVEKSKKVDEWYKDLNKWIRGNLPKTELNIEGGKLVEYMSPAIKELIEKEKYRIL